LLLREPVVARASKRLGYSPFATISLAHGRRLGTVTALSGITLGQHMLVLAAIENQQ
jgi:hypothetical protein